MTSARQGQMDGPEDGLTSDELAEVARQLRAVLKLVEAGELPAEGPKDRGIADRLRGALDVLDRLAAEGGQSAATPFPS